MCHVLEWRAENQMVSPLIKVFSQHNSRVDFVPSTDFQSLGIGGWSGGWGASGEVGGLEIGLRCAPRLSSLSSRRGAQCQCGAEDVILEWQTISQRLLHPSRETVHTLAASQLSVCVLRRLHLKASLRHETV